MEKIKGLIFDYGGTIDTGGKHWSWVIWEAWQQAGVAVSLEDFRVVYVEAERELARTRHILPEHDFADLLNIKINIELQYLAEQGKFPASEVAPYAKKISDICNEAAQNCVKEAQPVLEALATKYPMVLVSNFYGNIDKVLETYGIKKYFKKIIESAVVGVRKPNPEIFRLGIKALELPPEDCLVVGDSYKKDIVPALECECKAVWIKGPGWSGEEDIQEYNPCIKNLSELKRMLL